MYIMVGICPKVGLFIFTRFISNTLAFREILRNLLRSWVFPFWFSLSDFFWRSLQSFWRILYHCQFPRDLLGVFFLLILSEVSAIFDILLISACSLDGVLTGIYHPLVPFFLGGVYKLLGKTYLRLQAMF